MRRLIPCNAVIHGGVMLTLGKSARFHLSITLCVQTHSLGDLLLGDDTDVSDGCIGAFCMRMCTHTLCVHSSDRTHYGIIRWHLVPTFDDECGAHFYQNTYSLQRYTRIDDGGT